MNSDVLHNRLASCYYFMEKSNQADELKFSLKKRFLPE